jgi:hypothetical protein
MSAVLGYNFWDVKAGDFMSLFWKVCTRSEPLLYLSDQERVDTCGYILVCDQSGLHEGFDLILLPVSSIASMVSLSGANSSYCCSCICNGVRYSQYLAHHCELGLEASA